MRMLRQILLLTLLSNLWASSLLGGTMRLEGESRDVGESGRRGARPDWPKLITRMIQDKVNAARNATNFPLAVVERQSMPSASGSASGSSGGGGGGGGPNNNFSWSSFVQTTGITYAAFTMVKGGFIAMLTLAKAFSITVMLGTGLLLVVAGGAVFFVCAFTNCYGIIPGVGGPQTAAEPGGADGVNNRIGLEFVEEVLSIFKGIEEGYRKYEGPFKGRLKT